MALRVVGPLPTSAGLNNREIIAPGDTIGSVTVADAPAGAVLQVQVGNQPLIPMERGDILVNLTATDGRYGLYCTVPPTAGTVTFVVGVRE